LKSIGNFKSGNSNSTSKRHHLKEFVILIIALGLGLLMGRGGFRKKTAQSSRCHKL
jgi:hypothetical protein